MPKENFYDPSVPENENPEPATGKVFSVTWGIEGNSPDPVVRVAGIELDKSGLKRLIRVLNRAIKQSHKKA